MALKETSTSKRSMVREPAPASKRARLLRNTRSTSLEKPVLRKPALAPTQHIFPISNARGCPETETFVAMYQPLEDKGRPLNYKTLKLADDHLTQLPKPGFAYLSASGRRLFDRRYDEVKKSRSKPKPKPKPEPKPKRGNGRGKNTKKFLVISALPFDCEFMEDGMSSLGQTFQFTANPKSALPEDAFHSKPMINIPVPDHVQAMLVDDWENITKNNQLVPLPHPKPVSQILESYLAHERPHREEGSASMDILEEVIAGLREYFEKALSRILLYRFERHQYMDMRKLWDTNTEENSDYKSVCDVYGAEHLARLIVSLPELLAQTNMDQQSVSRLREEIGKFTVWLSRNCETYFVSEYETPSQEYIDKARSF
ncbi:hypothetical protein HIM_00091 [Hirsutella minnesotensis 3608]|nr:hypothetical protein HIM_00091 [Hirsutella minnesotensis 3608]